MLTVNVLILNKTKEDKNFAAFHAIVDIDVIDVKRLKS